MFLKISCQWECAISRMPSPPSSTGHSWQLVFLLWQRTSPSPQWTDLSGVKPRLPVGFAAVTVAAAFTAASPGLCFHNRKTLTSIFPKSIFPRPLSLRPSRLLFLPLSLSLPSLSLPPSLPPLTSLLASLLPSLPRPLRTHTLSEHPQCVRVCSRGSGDTPVNRADKSCPCGAHIGFFQHCSICQACGLQSSHSDTPQKR